MFNSLAKNALSRRVAMAVMLGLAPMTAVLAKDPAPEVKAAASTAAVKSVVEVSEPWIRATVSGQQATGGFMSLTAAQNMTLLGFETKVAQQAELHEMAMEGDVMRMRSVDALALPAGQTVSLKPGAHHLMLMGLKKPLAAGQTVQLTLLLKAEDGKVIKQSVKVPVKAQMPMMGGGESMHHHHHHH